jgi:hypothetical protein
MPTETQELAPLPPSNIPLLMQTGQITREWYIFFQSVDEVLRGLREEISLAIDGVDDLFEPQTDLSLLDGVTAPTITLGQAFIYVDTATGDLMVRFGDGVTKTITTDV